MSSISVDEAMQTTSGGAIEAPPDFLGTDVRNATGSTQRAQRNDINDAYDDVDRGVKASGERPYICEMCETSFKRKYSLVHHLRTHSDEKPFHCVKCPKSFKRKDHLVLKEDILDITPNITGTLPAPEGAFDNVSHESILRNLCKSFAHKQVLVRHHRFHTGDRPYRCDIYYLNNIREILHVIYEDDIMVWTGRGSLGQR
ncbi:zinc finger protein 271-like [Rhipicephalus sanguineus]|uniref:zinc finger protein 271-like n=1 Tax=Rhipicephalus sanguineus TaxID=34632 RepID=UPI0020C2C258|nr:zinc finger protein 271-like [Rhipicephalus sanguineus]